MHFTREPIVETVITSREGNRLVIKSSKAEREHYSVEAVEIVSFGGALFFRSQERPSAFLLPVTDYEVVEVKEMKSALKIAAGDRSIRIGGGRDAAVRAPQREQQEEGGEEQEQVQQERFDKKRDRRRRGRRRGEALVDPQRSDFVEESSQERESATQVIEKETLEVAPSFISKLFPPPPTLIKETLSRYKIVEEPLPPEEKPLPQDFEEGPSEEEDSE